MYNLTELNKTPEDKVKNQLDFRHPLYEQECCEECDMLPFCNFHPDFSAPLVKFIWMMCKEQLPIPIRELEFLSLKCVENP